MLLILFLTNLFIGSCSKIVLSFLKIKNFSIKYKKSTINPAFTGLNFFLKFFNYILFKLKAPNLAGGFTAVTVEIFLCLM